MNPLGPLHPRQQLPSTAYIRDCTTVQGVTHLIITARTTTRVELAGSSHAAVPVIHCICIDYNKCYKGSCLFVIITMLRGIAWLAQYTPLVSRDTNTFHGVRSFESSLQEWNRNRDLCDQQTEICVINKEMGSV